MSTRQSIIYWPRLGIHIYREILDEWIWIVIAEESHHSKFRILPPWFGNHWPIKNRP